MDDQADVREGKHYFVFQRAKIFLVKYGTLTCGDGFIRLDIYSKDIMLTVCFGIFILQGKNVRVSHKKKTILFSTWWSDYVLGCMLQAISWSKLPTK